MLACRWSHQKHYPQLLEVYGLHTGIKTQCQHLKITRHNELLNLLQKFEDLFDGTLGICKTYPVDFELKEDVNPILSRTCTVPEVHEEMSKKLGWTFIPTRSPVVNKGCIMGIPILHKT